MFVGGLQYDLFLSRELQYNLIRSHAAGVGTPLSIVKVRMLLALRINVLAKGHSGISLVTLYALIKAFNGKEIMLSQQFSQSINYHVCSHIFYGTKIFKISIKLQITCNFSKISYTFFHKLHMRTHTIVHKCRHAYSIFVGNKNDGSIKFFEISLS